MYALIPGFVTSKNGKQMHYINAEQLARLYKVNYKKCIVIDFNNPKTYLGRDSSKYIKLSPRVDGNYTLPQI